MMFIAPSPAVAGEGSTLGKHGEWRRPRSPLASPLPRSAGEGQGEGPVSLYDRFAQLYAHYRLHCFPDDRAEVAAALDLRGAQRLAELGCGPGLYATAFAAVFPALAVTGIDRAPAQVAIARRRAAARGLANADFLTGDAQGLTQPNAAFDRIVASRLLMIVDDPAAVLAEARRVLAPGGILLLAEPIKPETGVLALLRRAARASGERTSSMEPLVERHFAARAFRALVTTQPWVSVAVWEANGYRYARCRTDGDADRGRGRSYP
jgi:ubiquinone/menaquinone biosynthesis C-methylase UbiE